MRPLPVVALLAACAMAGSDLPQPSLPTPVEYVTVHGWVMEPAEGCYRYRYFQADKKYWERWVEDQMSSADMWGGKGADGRCYMFPSNIPADRDSFFLDDPRILDTAAQPDECGRDKFWDYGVCDGQVPFVLEDWWGWPASLPDGVIPQP